MAGAIVAVADGGADWRGPELLARQDWIQKLHADEIREIGAALAAVRARGVGIAQMRKEDFPIDRLSRRLENSRDELENGRGFVVFRGFPVGDYGVDDLRAIYWGLGLHLGTAVPQSRRNDFIGDVRNLNIGINTAHGRGYTSNEALSYHTDSADVAALLCVQIARSGGSSLTASSVAVHNEMLRRRPDLVRALYEPMPFSRMGNEGSSQLPWYEVPVFSLHEKRFCCFFSRVAAQGVKFIPAAPKPTEVQSEAVILLEEIAADPRFVLAFDMQPGDLQLLNSHVTLHNRTRFADWPEPTRRRHLLRLWLSVPNSRPLSPAMRSMYRETGAGAIRGGYLSAGMPRRFSTTDDSLAVQPAPGAQP